VVSPPAAPVVSPPAASVVSPPAAPVVSPPALAASAAEGAPASELPWARPPEPLRPAPSAPGEPVRVTLRCGSTVLRLRSGPAVPVGELIAGLVGSRLPLRTDATGRVLGWFRAQVDGAAVEAARPVGELAEGAELVLRVVDNRLLHADVHAEESGARFLTPVGAAVPVSSLAEHFAALLGLPVGERALECGGRELPGFAILDDLGALAPLVVLRLKAPRGGRA
jgi:hypothetical protein